MACSGTQQGRPAEEIPLVKRLDPDGVVRRRLFERDRTGGYVKELPGLIMFPEDELSRFKRGLDTQAYELRRGGRIELLEKCVTGCPGDLCAPAEFCFCLRGSHSKLPPLLERRRDFALFLASRLRRRVTSLSAWSRRISPRYTRAWAPDPHPA